MSKPVITGVDFFRCMQPLLFLQKFYGDKVKIISANSNNIMDAVAQADIYFHQSPGFGVMDSFVKIVRANFPKVKIVFDYDDAPLKYIDKYHPAYRTFGLDECKAEFGSLIDRKGKKIEFSRTWKNGAVIDGGVFHAGMNIKYVLDSQQVKTSCDYVTTTTPYLAEELKKEVFCPVEVLPNCVEPELYKKVADKDKPADQVRIGWVIGHSHLADMIDLLPALIDLLNERKNVKLYLMSQYNDMLVNVVKQCNIPAGRFIVFPSTGILNGYFDALRHMDLDIGLMHIKENNIYNKCKSPLKFLEMTASGAAVLAPDTLYNDYVVNEKTGLIYSNRNEFNALIRRLIDDASLRKSLQDNALDGLDKWSAKAVIPKYLEFFEGIMVKK